MTHSNCRYCDRSLTPATRVDYWLGWLCADARACVRRVLARVR